MLCAIGLITTTIFFSLSLLHVYWAFGSNWGLAASIPTNNGQPLFETGFWDTLAVAIALSILAANMASIRVMEKVGLQFQIKFFYEQLGREVVIYALDREEFNYV
jgi:hypothetical protein